MQLAPWAQLPSGGEIDVVEGVNSQTSNAMTLHTGPGCSFPNNGRFSGSMTTQNCFVNAPGQSTNAGCQITTTNSQSYGAGFSANGGGVYATEWTSESINVHFFLGVVSQATSPAAILIQASGEWRWRLSQEVVVGSTHPSKTNK